MLPTEFYRPSLEKTDVGNQIARGATINRFGSMAGKKKILVVDRRKRRPIPVDSISSGSVTFLGQAEWVGAAGVYRDVFPDPSSPFHLDSVETDMVLVVLSGVAQ